MRWSNVAKFTAFTLLVGAVGGVWSVVSPAGSTTQAETPSIVPAPADAHAAAPSSGAPLIAGSTDATDGFIALAPGLEYARFRLGTPSPIGDSMLRVVRVDPNIAEVSVGSVGITNGKAKEASAWGAEQPGAVAVINTSMFADDLATSVGYTRVNGVELNSRWAAQNNSALLMHPHLPHTPHFQIANLGCVDKDQVALGYDTVVQSIRLLGCNRENVWSQQPRQWSSVMVGMDGQQRALFLHVRSPYTMHDLVDLLVALPLDLVALHYGEGGPEASLYVRAGDFVEKNIGSYETGFFQKDDNDYEWPLPNVLIARAP